MENDHKMKITTLIFSFLLYQTAISQSVIELPKFQSIESNLMISIQIIKSKEYKLEFFNYQKPQEVIEWEVLDNRLTLTNKNNIKDFDLKDIQLSIYTPNLKELLVTNKGNISMDSKFSKINTFSVFAENGASIDLNMIVFNTLIIYKDPESYIKYGSVNTLINNKKPHKY